MGLKNSQYQAIMRKYEQKQLRNHDILTQHYEEVYRQLPEFKSLDDSISILSVQYGKRLLNGDQKAISSLKEELAILRASKQELLRSSGFPADYLEPVYDCPNCKDTGYIGNQKCHCFKKAIIDLLYEQSNLKEILKKENFSNFALDYYSTNFIDPKTGRSSRQVIEDALRICRNFVTSFGTDFQNLFLYGDVGVGKTFLSNSIGKFRHERHQHFFGNTASGFGNACFIRNVGQLFLIHHQLAETLLFPQVVYRLRHHYPCHPGIQCTFATEGEVGENFDEAIVQYVMGRIDIARIAVTYRQHLLGVEGV